MFSVSRRGDRLITLRVFFKKPPLIFHSFLETLGKRASTYMSIAVSRPIALFTDQQ